MLMSAEKEFKLELSKKRGVTIDGNISVVLNK